MFWPEVALQNEATLTILTAVTVRRQVEGVSVC